MIKNYFLELGEIFKNAFLFAKKTFKNTLVIWALILFQVVLAIPLLYFYKALGFVALSAPFKALFAFLLILYLFLFFVMFKHVFDLAATEFEKPKLTLIKVLNSLLSLALFNCIPVFALVVCFNIAQLLPDFAIYLKIGLNIFTALFYFCASLSVAGIALWQDKISFVAIFKSMKVFFKKIGYTFFVFLVLFFLALVISYLICTLLYAIGLYFNFLDENLVNSIHAVVNVYSLYVIFGLYIGAQCAILRKENE